MFQINRMENRFSFCSSSVVSFVLGKIIVQKMWKYTYVYLVVDDETQEKTTKRDYISIVFPFLHSLSFDFSLK